MFKKLGFLLIIAAAFIAIYLLTPEGQKQLPKETKIIPEAEFWPYRCIDTMKTSRDNARRWQGWSGLDAEIKKETKEVSDIGANCIAIATPYDKEFLPYLKKWIKAARDENLHIWFRGNFSSWEGWFDYSKNMTSSQLFSQTSSFITQNPDLFKDGDIFTAAPEAENGGEFDQVEKDEHEVYRKFLIKEVEIQNQAFAKINKKVTTNWLSMNGGLARRMFDQPTVDSVGKLVTIDHYIKTPGEMGEYIKYFNNKFGAKVAVGEFGAPIPQINGQMTEKEQADFINQLMMQLYLNRHSVEGLSYWDLIDGSTALYNSNHTPRKAVGILANYFQPATIKGQVTDTLGKRLQDIRIETSDKGWDQKTDSYGLYNVLVPTGEVEIKISSPNYFPQTFNVRVEKKQILTQNFVLEPLNKDSFRYRLRLLLQDLRNRVSN